MYQRYICIFLCLVYIITVLPLYQQRKQKNQTVRVGWYEGTYNTKTRR